ncbi:MAG TPA: tetratricopeptide repeat protein, partial [Thermoanaerobaculia bacterium]
DTYRVFLSAVTRELGSYRKEVARVLRRKEIEVREQEHFRQGPATLLERLQAYIEQCDAVILLIGERCGAFPTEEHVAALGTVPVFESYRRSTGQARASYTQWELFLAKQYGKETYVFLSTPGFTPDEPNTEGADLQACQAAYRAWVKASGEHYDGLTTREKLVEDVLVLPFPDLSAPKPIVLPFPSLGPLFHGREGMLARLRETLESAPAGRATAIAGKAVHGLGGVGKTRLAVEYAWKHAADYSAVLFVGAGSPADLRRNLAALSDRQVLDLLEQEAKEEEVREAAVLGWLGEHPGWLLILDNVDLEDAAAAVDALVSRLHGGHVLLTGRLARWSAEVEPLELDVLTEEAAAGFLLARTQGRRRATNEDAAYAAALARELGFLPLALEQAGAYIAERRLTLAAYLDEWRSRRDQVLGWFDPRVSHYPASVAVTWQTSFDRLSAPARRLLERLAWLGPEPIPESLLDVPVPELPEPEPDLDPRDALVELATYSLVTRAADTPTFTVHRLVQDVTRRRVMNDPANGSLAEALHWVDAAFVGDPQDVRTWPTLDPLAPHVRAVVSFPDAAGITDPTARLMSDVGALLFTKALVDEAEPLMRRALAIDEKSLGAEHPDVATRLNDLAQVLLTTNRLAEAEPLMGRALAIDEKSFGPEHPTVAIRLNNLAQLLQVTNRLAEAEPLMRRALAIDEKSFGPEHPKVAIGLNNLAALLQTTNRFAEAEPLMARVVTIFESSLGEHHPNVAIALNNLAQLLLATSRLTEAEPLMRRALAIHEKSFGPDHPNVAVRLNNLARLLQATSRFAEAEPLMRRHLVIFIDFSRRTGHEHPHLQAAFRNYRHLLQDMGNSDAEIEAAIEALVRSPE